MHLPDSRDSWIGDVQDRSAVRNSHLILAGSSWKSLAYSELGGEAGIATFVLWGFWGLTSARS